MVSESTLYRLVDYNLFSARNIDLPRKVRYKPRRHKKNFKVDKGCRIGRTFEDFQKFMECMEEAMDYAQSDSEAPQEADETEAAEIHIAKDFSTEM